MNLGAPASRRLVGWRGNAGETPALPGNPFRGSMRENPFPVILMAVRASVSSDLIFLRLCGRRGATVPTCSKKGELRIRFGNPQLTVGQVARL